MIETKLNECALEDFNAVNVEEVHNSSINLPSNKLVRLDKIPMNFINMLLV